MTEQRPIRLIGLGLMGNALAGRLMKAFDVIGYDVEGACRERLTGLGGNVASDCRDIAARCDRILLSLPTTEIVEQVISAMDRELEPGKILIDTTTGDPDRVERIGERLATGGVSYLDATISGSSAQTARGEILVLAGGPRLVFDSCVDLFRTFAARWFHIGLWGSGTRMKLVTNLVLGLNRAALAEGLALAAAMGLDAATTMEILAQSAAYSRAMDVKGRKMVEQDFTPEARLSQHLKDVRLILSTCPRSIP